MKNFMSKQERRIYQLQEYTFWRLHRPLLVPGSQSFKDMNELKLKDVKNAQMTEEAYEVCAVISIRRVHSNFTLSSHLENTERPSSPELHPEKSRLPHPKPLHKPTENITGI